MKMRNNGASSKIFDGMPFIDREKEMASVIKGLRSALRKKGGMFLVEGEAGIGKTRFIIESRSLAADMGFHILSGKCIDNRGRPNQPFIEMMREHFGSPFGGSDGDSIEKLADPIRKEFPAMSRYAYDLIDLFLDHDTPEGSPEGGQLSENNGPPQDAQAPCSIGQFDQRKSGISVHELLSLFFREMSVWTPIVIVMEDIQYADKATLNLVHLLSRKARGESILILCSCRSDGSLKMESREPGDNLRDTLRRMSREHLFARIKLERFDQKRSMKLAAAVLGHEMDLKDLGAMMRETGGNPGHVIDLLTKKNGSSISSSPAQGAGGAGEEETAAGLIPSIGDNDKRVLEMASVIGENITVEWLKTLLEMDEAGVLDSLDPLMEMKILQEKGDTFIFQSKRLKDSVYQGIPARSRRSMHRKVAKMLALAGGQEIESGVNDLNLHLYHCGEYRKALSGLIERSERLYRSGDLDPALSLLDLVDDCLERLERSKEMQSKRIRACQLRGDVQDARGCIDDGMASYRKAIEHAEKSGLDLFSPRNYRRMGDLLLKRYDWDLAVQYYLRSLQTSKHLGNTEETALSFRGLGSIYLLKGEYRRSIECYIKYMEYQGTRIGPDSVRGLVEMGDIYFQLGDLNQALAYYKLAIRRGEEGKQENETSLAYVKMANVLLKLGEVEEARRYGDLAMDSVHSKAPSAVTIETMILLADLAFEIGEMEKADRMIQDIEGSMEGMDRLLYSTAQRVKGMVLANHRDFPASESHMKEAVSTLEGIDAPYHLALSYLNYGLVRFQQMDVDGALEMLGKAGEIFKSIRSLHYFNLTSSKIREASFIKEILRIK
ncbi:MAG: AAA family ATPase [Candidatus Thermoplasmatota archaeon]|nr:AAA family ATPase [Candidatus Thermoplasmatota archaeon]